MTTKLNPEEAAAYERSNTVGAADDLTLLQEVSGEAIVSTLSTRYKDDSMYTSIGPVRGRARGRPCAVAAARSSLDWKSSLSFDPSRSTSAVGLASPSA